MNLAEIIGRVHYDDDHSEPPEEEDYLATRIADLEVVDGKLWITEACDGYFVIELTRSETQRFIDWLQKTMADLRKEPK